MDIIKRRLPVIIIGIPSVLLILNQGGQLFFMALTIVALICINEFYRIAKTKELEPNIILGNLSIVAISYLYYNIYQNTLTPLKKRNSASDCNLIDVGIAISERLPDAMGLEDVTKVLIENQIGPLAIRMKCVQGMLTQFFIEKGITDITFVSSSNKLKHFDLPKKNYKERKSSGIIATSEYIINSNVLQKWKSHFDKHKKKDDLADSFLQGLWYIKHS